MAAPPKKRLGELLVEAGVIDDHQLRAALGHQRQWGGKLGQALVDLKLVSEPQIVSALSRKLGFEIVQLDALARTAALEAALKLVPRDAARRNNILPMAADVGSVTIAMSDPTNLAITDELSFRTGRRVKIALAGDREVARAVSRLYFPEEQPEAHAVAIDEGESLRPLNGTYDALPDHVQQRFYRSSMRAIEAGPAVGPDGVSPVVPASEAPPPPPIAIAPAVPRPAPGAIPEPSSTSREAALRDAIDRMAMGDEAPGGLRAGRLVAAMARALLRRGLVTEAEIIAELTQIRR